MSTITSLEQQKNDKTRCSVYLDGVFYCGLKIEVAVKYRLKPGMTIEKSELDAIQFENEKVQATERAMNHLSATMKTCRQMRDFLNSKGYTNSGIVDFQVTKTSPTGNAIVQDVLDCASGARRPVYDFTRPLAYDPTLLRSDYVLRTTAQIGDAEEFGPGALLVRDLTAEAARALLDEALAADPTTFMAALPASGE